MRRRAAKGGEGEEMHTEKLTHHNVSVLLHAHTFKPNTSARRSPMRSQMQEKDISEDNFLSVCVCVCLDARAMFMSGDTRKTSIKVREAGVCPSDR